jgi:hypothetical protein
MRRSCTSVVSVLQALVFGGAARPRRPINSKSRDSALDHLDNGRYVVRLKHAKIIPPLFQEKQQFCLPLRHAVPVGWRTA